MRYFYIFLSLILLTTPSFAFGLNYEYCKNNESFQGCDVKIGEYRWGKKFIELNRQIDELQEKIRQAVITDDYSEIYPYLQLPVSFYLDDFREAILRMEGKSYAWKATSNEEFKSLFKKLLELDRQSYDAIQENRFSKYYSAIGSIDLSSFLDISIDPKCNKFIPTPKKRYMHLPEELNLCETINLKIRSIATNVY